jgi:mRNA interferase RelE/StbE
VYEIRLSKPALKALIRMPRAVAARMRREFDAIALDPQGYRGDWQRLEGLALWRLRVGDWRAICEVRERELVVLVVKIGPRGDVYK